MHLPPIITDLAMILLVAGVTTIIFKKLNQPLVLGYIIAGFITGPHFNFFPTVSDMTNIHTWSEIGVIFLLFALGLEFSFYKLKSVGSTAFIATAVEIGGMLAAGYACGTALGWNHMDSLFLGGMLSMSSTTIIIKAFEDLKLKGQRFTELVFGVLIVEDIAGIVMMVLLATLAAAAGISSMELAGSVVRLIFFLILWFVLGMYLVPTFFKRARSLMNAETLLVASIGLCLGMVVLATNMGFSSALGAFIMGSLIAEAPNAEEIEHLVKPVKDLFGAVFFVSVGMLVDPSLLLKYAVPIICIIVVTIVGKLIFSSGGVLASGQNLYTSLHCGFSLAQIGEFSFIIASLGMSLGVISDFLYPIIVAVSVMTTFTTPFFIMAAEPVYQFTMKALPEPAIRWLKRYTESSAAVTDDKDWQNFLQGYITRMLIFAVLLAAVALGAEHYLLPYLADLLPTPYSNLLAAAVTLLIMSPVLRAMLVNRTGNGELFSVLWFKKRANHIPLAFLVFCKILLAAASIYFVFHTLIGLHNLLAMTATVIAAYLISSSEWLLSEYLRIEARFLINLNEKHMLRHRQLNSGAAENWFDEDLQLALYNVADNSNLIGKTLIQTSIRQQYGCNVLQIKNQERSIDMPGGQQLIDANMTLLIIGTKAQFKSLSAAITAGRLGLTPVENPLNLRQFMLKETDKEQKFFSCAITIDEHCGLLGKSIKAANIRDKWHCLVVGLERGSYTMTNPNVSLVFEKNDLLWVLGKQKMINTLVKEEIL